MMYRSALVSIGGYAVVAAALGWAVEGPSALYGLAALAIALSVPMLRAPATIPLRNVRRHAAAIWLGFAATTSAAVLAGSSVADSFSASPRDPGSGSIAFEAVMALICALSVMSAGAHASELLARRDDQAKDEPVRTVADELRFSVRWLAASLTLAAAGWSLMLAPTVPIVVLLSGWLVTVMAALVLESMREADGTPSRKGKVFSVASVVVAAGVAAAATAAILGETKPAVLTAAWFSEFAAFATMAVVLAERTGFRRRIAASSLAEP